MSTPAKTKLSGALPAEREAFAAARGYACLTVAEPKRVPKEIAVCPECGGGLWWQCTTTDWLRDLSIDCETEDEDDEDSDHRGWQSDWQPVIDKVRRWLGSGMGTHIAPGERLPTETL